MMELYLKLSLWSNNGLTDNDGLLKAGLDFSKNVDMDWILGRQPLKVCVKPLK